MHLACTAEQEALREELRDYFATIVTPEVEDEMARGEMGGPHCLEAVRQMGRDNWLAVSWPAEYGGRGLSLMEQFIFFEEAHRVDAPVPFLTVLVLWLTLTFAVFGLFAPRNLTVVSVLLVCALSVAAAVFLVLEMDGPFGGIIQVSPAPLNYALEHLGR